MTISRKVFLNAAVGGTVLILLDGCGGGGSSSSSNGSGSGNPQPSGQTCGATGAEIAGNHGHSLSIPSVDLDSAVDKTYDITGSANHSHSVTFTPAQLQALKSGQVVMVLSTTNSAHDHQVSTACA